MKKLMLTLALFVGISTSAQLIPPSYDTNATAMGTMYNDAITIIFIAEGYTASEESDFIAWAQHAKSLYTSTYPYDQLYTSNKINFRYYFDASVDSGISTLTHVRNPLTETIYDTRWNAHYNFSGLGHSLYVEEPARAELEDMFGHYINESIGNKVYLVMICNDGGWGGAGELPSEEYGWETTQERRTSLAVLPTAHDYYNYAPAADSDQSNLNAFTYLLLHETCHSIADFDDEYESASTYNFYETYYPGYLASRPLKRNLNWNWNPQGYFEYEGGRYLSTGIWRRGENDLSRGYASWVGNVVVWPSEYHSDNAYDIYTKLSSETVKNLTIFQSTNGSSVKDVVCGKTANKEYRHDGSGIWPVVGDRIYTHANMPLIDNDGNWFLLDEFEAFQVNSIGEITKIEACESIIPRSLEFK